MASEFFRLAAEWRDATLFSSSIAQIEMHPAYQRIIGMGPSVTLLILSQLEAEPAQWFWALMCATGENPVPADATFDEAVKTWLKWGHDKGLMADG